MKFKGPIQLTPQGKLNKGLMLMERVVLNANDGTKLPGRILIGLHLWGEGDITCDIFESTGLLTLITVCTAPNTLQKKQFTRDNCRLLRKAAVQSSE